MCVSGPKAFLLQKQAPCRAEVRRRSRRASSEPGTTASSPPQRDRGLPKTLPKEPSGAWTAVQKLALELDLASGSGGPGLPPSPAPPWEHHPRVRSPRHGPTRAQLVSQYLSRDWPAPVCHWEILHFKGLYKVSL